jgi:hypothetical protein
MLCRIRRDPLVIIYPDISRKNHILVYNEDRTPGYIKGENPILFRIAFIE